MPKPKHSRIYILDGDVRYDFLWADSGDDGSVYFGLLGSGLHTVEQISAGPGFDAEGTVFHPFEGPHKVSFHASGQCVLGSRMETGGEVTRLASHGAALSEIHAPVRMMDVITPVRHLARSNKSLPDGYLDLGGFLATTTHICCTVYCMPQSQLPSFGKDRISTIRGSTWQSTNALLSGGNAWHFTLHDAVDDSAKQERSIVSVHGCGTRSVVS